MANILSEELRIITKDQLKQFQRLPLKVRLPKFLIDFDNDRIMEIMKLDKKSRSGKLNFVLLKNFGELVIDVKLSSSKLDVTLNEFKKTISV